MKKSKEDKPHLPKINREDIRKLVSKGSKGDQDAVELLLNLTGKVDPVLLTHVIKGLGEIKSREAFQGLLDLLSESSMKDVARYLVKMVLSKEGYLQRQFLLEALTKTKEEDVLLFLVSLVGKWQLVEAEEQLLVIYEEGETPEVKGAVLAALGQMGTENSIPLLKEALKSESDFIVYNATQAMWRVGLRIATYPLLVGIRKGEQLGSGLVSSEGLLDGDQAVPILLEHYRTKRPEERQMVLDSLIKIGRPAVRHLLSFLGDSDENLRILAATQLGYIGDEESVDHLIAALDTPSENTRYTVVEALGKIQHPKAVPIVVRTLDDPSEEVRLAAWQSLYNLDPKTFFEQVTQRLPKEPSKVVLSGFARIIEDSVIPQGLETITGELEKLLPPRGKLRMQRIMPLRANGNDQETWKNYLDRWRLLLTDGQEGFAGIERLLERMLAFSRTNPDMAGATHTLQFALKQVRQHRPFLEKAPGAMHEFNHAVTHLLEGLAAGQSKEADNEFLDTVKRLMP